MIADSSQKKQLLENKIWYAALNFFNLSVSTLLNQEQKQMLFKLVLQRSFKSLPGEQMKITVGSGIIFLWKRKAGQ